MTGWRQWQVWIRSLRPSESEVDVCEKAIPVLCVRVCLLPSVSCVHVNSNAHKRQFCIFYSYIYIFYIYIF